jgi:ABC-type transport system involved in multi-copper enzyme maturation permease subunit
MPIDLILFAENPKITNWLSPVWIMSLGIGLGFLLVLVGLLKIQILQKFGWFNSISDSRNRFIGVGIITSLTYFGLFFAFLAWQSGWKIEFSTEIILTLVFAAVISFIMGFGVWALLSRRIAGEFNDLVWNGFLKSVNRVCIGAVLFALVGLGLHAVNGFGLIRFFDQPIEFLHALTRIPVMGTFEKSFELAPSSEESTGEKLEIAFDGAELDRMQITTSSRLLFSAEEIKPDLPFGRSYPIDANDSDNGGEPFLLQQQPGVGGLIPAEPIEHLYVKNLGRDTAQIQVRYSLRPAYAEAYVIPMIVVLVIGLYFGYLFFAALSPKIAAIALSTYKTEIGQPLFWLIIAIALTFILLTIFVPYNTFGEDIKMYTDSGLTLIRVAAIFFAVWAASKSVAEEIEGRTALTVLSKPVGRRQFVVGKFAGISMAVALMFILVGLWFFVWVAFKPIYDYQEASKGLAEWSVCFAEAFSVIPGLFLCFLEVLIFVAISVAISTRMGILANFLICFSIYVLGHLTPLLVQSSLGAFEVVAVFGQIVAIIFPVLNHFDVQTAINTGSPVPLVYLAWSVVYTLVYGTMVLLVALVLFEDRDLA